jgi:transcriptional regulator with XRE-family HTH domain
MRIGDKLRKARRSQNLSLRDLAGKVQVSASLLSQIETGKANPSVATLYNIAAAVALPMDYFLSEDDGVPSAATTRNDNTIGHANSYSTRKLGRRAISDTAASLRADSPVVRSDHRAMIELMGGVTWERLTPGPEEQIEFLEVCYEPGASSGGEMSHHSGREFGIVLVGELIIELGFERYALHPGDSVIFASTTPHRLTNPGQIPMRAIWVIFNT